MAGFKFNKVGFVGSLGSLGNLVGGAPANLFKNGNFDEPATGNTATGWNAIAPAAISGGALALNGNTNTTQSVTFVSGTMYRLSCTLRSASVGAVLVLTNSGQNGQINGSNQATTLNSGQLTASIDFTAVSTSELYFIRGNGGTDALVESISITVLS